MTWAKNFETISSRSNYSGATVVGNFNHGNIRIVTPVLLICPFVLLRLGRSRACFNEHGTRSLTEDLRNRLGVRASALTLETIRPYFGSLERDPIHPEAFYLAVDGIGGQPLLMRSRRSTPRAAFSRRPS